MSPFLTPLIFEDVSPSTLWVRIDPLVNVKSRRSRAWVWLVLLHLGSELSLSSALHTHLLLLSPGSLCPFRCTGTRPPLVGEPWTWPFRLILRHPSPSFRVGGEDTSLQKTCTFLTTSIALQLSRGEVATLPAAQPCPALLRPAEPRLTSSVLPFPKRCLTGFVLTLFLHMSVVPT